MKEVFLKDVVTPDFVSVAPDCLLPDAIKHMNDQKASYILVVKDDVPQGIVTERDMVGFLMESFEGVTWNDMPVDHVMTAPVTVVGWDNTVVEALLMKQGGHIRHMPVVDDQGRVVGVLTQENIISMLMDFCEDNGFW